MVISEASNDRFARLSNLVKEMDEPDVHIRKQKALIDSVDPSQQTSEKSLLYKYYSPGYDLPSVQITRAMIVHFQSKTKLPTFQRFFATVHAHTGFTEITQQNQRT